MNEVPDEIQLVRVDYRDPDHAHSLVQLLDLYASEPAGGGVPLSPEVKRDLVPALAARVDAVSCLAFLGDQPVGLITCIEGFSTFAAQPLLNIHDVVVHPEFRGRGIGRRLLAEAEAVALRRGCCKLTLEVLSENEVARVAYQRFGFKDYQLDPVFGHANFMEKKIGR